MGMSIDVNAGIVHKYVYELRYDFGQVYWDRGGRIAKEILSEREEWDFDKIDINCCQLANRDLNLAFNFGHAKLDLSQTQTVDVESLLDVGEFAKLAETITSTVVSNLELEFFPRMGFRVWHLYPSMDREQSHQMVQDLKLFRLDSALSSTLGDVSEVSHKLVVDRQRHMLRIAVAPFEQQVELPPSLIRSAKVQANKEAHAQRQKRIDALKAQKKISHYPHFGVLLDLDAYLEDPPYPDGLSISDFITRASEDFRDIQRTVLTAADDR